MFQFDFIGEARLLLDSLIDDSLTCQEQLLSGQITTAKDLSHFINRIIDIKLKSSQALFKCIEDEIRQPLAPAPKPQPIIVCQSQADYLLSFY